MADDNTTQKNPSSYVIDKTCKKSMSALKKFSHLLGIIKSMKYKVFKMHFFLTKRGGQNVGNGEKEGEKKKREAFSVLSYLCHCILYFGYLSVLYR